MFWSTITNICTMGNIGGIRSNTSLTSEKKKYWASSIVVAAIIFIVHALLDPYFHIFQIGGIIVSGLTSSFCGLLIVL